MDDNHLLKNNVVLANNVRLQDSRAIGSNTIVAHFQNSIFPQAIIAVNMNIFHLKGFAYRF